MNKTINQYINQLHLDPKREAAVRKLVESVEESPQVDKLVEILTIKPKYEFVDLGLPSGIKWATCNIGANSPEEPGLYFAWGETEGYTAEDVNNDVKQFNWADYKLCDGSNTTLTKYNNNSSYGTVDTLTTLEQVDDAAYVSDKTCRIPTKADFEELTANTTSTWETLNGVNGRRFTSNINGNSIFVPAAGYCFNGSVYDVGSGGYLWGSSLYESNSRRARYLYFNSDYVNVGIYYRCNGLPVRAVQDSNSTSEGTLFNPANYVTKTELDKTIIKDGDGTKFLTDSGKYISIPRQIDVTDTAATISNISNYQGLSIVYGGGTLGLSTDLEALIAQNPTKHYKFNIAVMNTSEESTVTIDTSKFKIADPVNNTITIPADGSVIIECYTGDGYVFVKW